MYRLSWDGRRPYLWHNLSSLLPRDCYEVESQKHLMSIEWGNENEVMKLSHVKYPVRPWFTPGARRGYKTCWEQCVHREQWETSTGCHHSDNGSLRPGGRLIDNEDNGENGGVRSIAICLSVHDADLTSTSHKQTTRWSVLQAQGGSFLRSRRRPQMWQGMAIPTRLYWGRCRPSCKKRKGRCANLFGGEQFFRLCRAAPPLQHLLSLLSSSSSSLPQRQRPRSRRGHDGDETCASAIEAQKDLRASPPGRLPAVVLPMQTDILRCLGKNVL